MAWHADAHFRTGEYHAKGGYVCQDYTLSSDNDGCPFAVVSDGCSSSGRTDLGSRVWCLAASKTLRVAKYGDADCLGAHIGIRAFEFASGMDMSEEDMDATLGIATITKSGTPAGYLIGDGAIVLGYKDSIHVVVAEWSGNMPGYPSYAEGADSRYKSFCAQSDDYAVSEGRSAFTVSYYRLGSEKPYSVMRCDAAEGLNGWVVNGYQDATFLAVFTDGVGQVSGLSLHEVVRELTDFPVARGGAFVRRQINSALNGWAKKGHYPQDDISMACLIRVPDDV